MSDKIQKIKEEIERRIENLSYLIPDVSKIGNLTKEDVGYFAKSEALKSILQFIDSLPEEPASEDLEEDSSFEKLLQEIYVKYGKQISIEKLLDIASHFAEWQKQQMMKDAIESIVEDWCGDSPEITIPLNPQDFEPGDKVKIIIVKEEQQ